MNNLKKIKIDQKKIEDIYTITYALRTIATTQSRQFTKRRRDYEPVREEIARILYFFNKQGKLDLGNRSDKTKHIIFSTDQKFCKNFLNGLQALIMESEINRADEIMLFGSRLGDICKTRVLPENVKIYKALKNFDECESVALHLAREDFPNTYLYAYHSEMRIFRRLSLIPFCSDALLFEDPGDQEIYYTNKYDLENLLHMHLSGEIYYAMIESGLKERLDRAISMSEASKNAENESARLKKLYNSTRQAIITAEIINNEQ